MGYEQPSLLDPEHAEAADDSERDIANIRPLAPNYDPNERGSDAWDDLGGGHRDAREGDLEFIESDPDPSISRPELRIGGFDPILGRPVKNDRDLEYAIANRRAQIAAAAGREAARLSVWQRAANQTGVTAGRATLRKSQ